MTALIYRFPAHRIERLAPRGGTLTDGRPCRLLQVGCGRVKVEYLDDKGAVTTEWFNAESVLLREYERLMDTAPCDTERM